MKDGLGPGGASRYHSGQFSQTEFIGEGQKSGALLGGNDDYDFLDHITLLKGFEREEKNGSARQLQKLLGPLASHPRALPGGGYDCDVHMRQEGLTTAEIFPGL